MSDSIGKGFSLVMELDDPNKLGELMARLDHPKTKPGIQRALASLDYVHYARFLPLWKQGLLLIVTEFDGEMRDYVMDFAAALDTEFSLILSYMKGYDARCLPVSAFPDVFWAYVDRNTRPPAPLPPYPEPFSAYPGVPVLEIAGAARAKLVPPAPQVPLGQPDLDQVQAHIVRGYRAQRGRHLGLTFTDAAKGRALLRTLRKRNLVSSDSAARGKPQCMTLGLTHAGLQALGLAQSVLERFPLAFREGPRLRTARLGDQGASDPQHWQIAGYVEGSSPPQPVPLHAMLSLYVTGDAAVLRRLADQITELLNGHATVCFHTDVEALGEHGEIHFGYRDGIGQPRLPGTESSQPRLPSGEASTPERAGMRPPNPTGDVFLGRQYRNARGGCPIGALPDALATHGTYAAVRVIEQDVPAFEQLLANVRAQHGIEADTTAAKLVGRWRNGSALALNPSEAGDVTKKSAAELDDFDYAAPKAAYDDRDGRRCPFGAHIRRLNPRSGMVLGVPWGRTVMRRGMPYGPAFDPSHPKDGKSRGLFGLFFCADLESQFEFLQHVWANEDLSGPNLRHTQDVFAAREQATPFRFRPRDNEAELTIMVPPLTRTIGSAYLLMPGLSGIDWLASAAWAADAPDAGSAGAAQDTQTHASRSRP